MVDTLGLASNFVFFAVLNLAGAVLVYFTIARVRPMHSSAMTQSPFAAMIAHWRNPALRAAFGVGFCILFAFIGTFTFVNFVLVRPPLSLGRMDLGFVYFVFLPSIVTTLLAGKAVARFGTRPAIWGALAVAALGPSADAVVASRGRADRHDPGRRRHVFRAGRRDRVRRESGKPNNRGIASGTYLACYFFGGLVGSAVLGQLFDRFGWTVCVMGVGLAIAVAARLTARLRQ